MKPNFYASVCHQGVHGGAIKLTNDCFVFQTQKITIADRLRELKIPYNEISEIKYAYALIFTMADIKLVDGSAYKFLIFNIKRFKKIIEEKMLCK